MTVRKEALKLVGLVVAVDAVFIAAYFLAHIERAPDESKVAFTVVWTAITLAIVLLGLRRIRTSRRSHQAGGPRTY